MEMRCADSEATARALRSRIQAPRSHFDSPEKESGPTVKP